MATVLAETTPLVISSSTLTMVRTEITKFTAAIAMIPFTSGFKNDITDTSDRRDMSFTQGFYDKPSGSTSGQFWA